MAYNFPAQAEPRSSTHPHPFLDLRSPVQEPAAVAWEGTWNRDRISRDDRRQDGQDAGDSRARSILRSVASSHSDEVVSGRQKDGHDHIAPLYIQKRHTGVLSPTLVTSPAFTQSSFDEEAPTRTASISRHLPMNHPKPDLQSMQGAYVKNVERLEEHAERLSMTSSLEDELQKMKLEQKQLQRQSSAPSASATAKLSPHVSRSRKLSSGSFSNSITGVNAAARSGGYSPSGYVTSFRDPARTGSSSQLPSRNLSKSSDNQIEPQSSYEDNDELPPPPPSHSTPYLGVGLSSDSHGPVHRQASTASDRPATSASNDTSHQAVSLFRDFDGVHYTAQSLASVSRQTSLTRQVSLSQPPLARDATAHREPLPGQNMVYYPAPVPMMLNLPQKLSKQSHADRERRRIQALSTVSMDMRKSAPWLDADTEATRKNRQSLASLPPQLRASAFFDQPAGPTQDIELEGGSAVATLDKILDASAYAPVNAFVDHPIAGRVGSEVYGVEAEQKRKSVLSENPKKEKGEAKKMKRKSSTGSLSNMLGMGRRGSGGTVDEMGRNFSGESRMLKVEEDKERGKFNSLQDYANKIEDEAEESIKPDEDELDGERGSDEDEDEEKETALEEEDPEPFYGAPTTLLAELQMRKAKQKGRKRTAADAVGADGMYTTLLEMDAVTQLQLKSRKQKHVTLAWEDENEAERVNFDDEDVPLGVLFPGQMEKQRNGGDGAVGGLLAMRDIEDNEPLSRRRERLNPNARSMRGSAYAGSYRGEEDEVEGETLGARLKRIKAEKEQQKEKQEKEETAVAGEFVDEGSGPGQLGLRVGGAASRTPDANETLGKRKKRLQEEAKGTSRQVSAESARSNGKPPPPLKTRHSMASILSAHPMSGPGGRVVSGLTRNLGQQQQQQQQQQPVMPMGYMNPGMPNMFGAGMPQMYSPSIGMNTMGMQPQMWMGNGVGGGYGMPMNPAMMGYVMGMGPPLDPKQRDGIEQWRQSVA